MTENISDDDNDGCNDNYDGNDGNFDDNDDKNYQKNIHIKSFGQKFTTFRDYYMVKKGPKNSGKAPPPPPLSGNARKKTCFFMGGVPLHPDFDNFDIVICNISV